MSHFPTIKTRRSVCGLGVIAPIVIFLTSYNVLETSFARFMATMLIRFAIIAAAIIATRIAGEGRFSKGGSSTFYRVGFEIAAADWALVMRDGRRDLVCALLVLATMTAVIAVPSVIFLDSSYAQSAGSGGLNTRAVSVSTSAA